MKKYYCTVLFDASSNVIVEANTPEEAVEKAEYRTEGNQRLCHQCAETLDTGDITGVLVHDENAEEELLDTRYQPQRTWVGLTDEEIDAAFQISTYQTEPIRRFTPEIFARTVEAKLKQKNGYAEEKNT